ncbi:MAG: hypothetical protein RJA86_1742 [Pseudomonadota bacterium]
MQNAEWNFIAFTKAETQPASTASDGIQTSIAAGDEAKRLLLPQHMNNGIEVAIYDVRTPAVPSKAWTLTLDGDLLASRKIGNTLYLVSSYLPSLPTLNYAATTKSELEVNEDLIEKTSLEKLLPTYAINGAASQPLNKTSCLSCLPTGILSGLISMTKAPPNLPEGEELGTDEIGVILKLLSNLHRNKLAYSIK